MRTYSFNLTNDSLISFYTNDVIWFGMGQWSWYWVSKEALLNQVPIASFLQVCRRTGDPNKLMFCKRCDGAYHCYCQHPSHKVGCTTYSWFPIFGWKYAYICSCMLQNVSAGVYVCPKHTKCHSCGSNVPGNGLSVRYGLLLFWSINLFLCLHWW